METVWFIIIAVMLAVYVVLDGFDFGAGILHLLVARNNEERRTVLASIGPLWDGNEVWLVASGGVLVFAFPKAYAAGFSGFYLPLMIVLWLLILRGLSIEFRSHEKNRLWRSFWDGTFCFSSTLMAIFLGAALGNVVRGVPIDASGYFAGPLFTDFMPRGYTGVLDWYTILVGVFALLALAAHGALFLVWKTEGAVQARSRKLASLLWPTTLIVGVLTTIGTHIVQPELYENLVARIWTWSLVLLIIGSLVSLFVNFYRRRELPAFLSSSLFILSMLGATAAGMFPNVLISTIDRHHDLDIYSAAAGSYSLSTGLVWWVIALLLALGYFSFMFHSFRGKVKLSGDGH